MAYHLSLSGDTLEVMQAVLNSNFWLATHVVAMTIGYAILFMAGFFALGGILMGTLNNFLSKDRFESMGTLVYVFLLIALFFNFVGTVLGGGVGRSIVGTILGMGPQRKWGHSHCDLDCHCTAHEMGTTHKNPRVVDYGGPCKNFVCVVVGRDQYVGGWPAFLWVF